MKKTIVIVLVIALLIQPLAALGFNDLNRATWAEPYVIKLAQKGIVNGYSDGSYRPLEAVSYYAAILVIYRTLEAEGLIAASDADVYVNRYQSTLNTYDVPTWPDLARAVAYCLEKDIIKAESLATFKTNETQRDITRGDMALYMGRAWNLYLKEDVNQIIDLDFKDVDDISVEALKYVNILHDHGIISGDSKGYFKPADSLNRAALAKLIVTGLDALEKTDNSKKTEIEASVYVKLDDTRKIVFYKKDSTTKSYIEKIDDDIAITVDGNKAGYTDLVQDQQVTLVYNNDKLVAIIAKPLSQSFGEKVGRITETVSTSGKRFIYMINSENNELEYYQLTADAAILQGEQAGEFSTIASGDTVAIKLNKGLVSELRFELKPDRFSGVLKAIGTGKSPKLTLGIESGELTFASDAKTVITRSGKPAKLSELVIGDQVTLVARRRLAESISANPADLNIEGRVSAIDGYKLTIDKRLDDSRATYDVNPQVVVLIDGSQQRLTDIVADDRVSLEIADDKVIKIAVTRVESIRHHVGRILKLYPEVASLELSGNEDYSIQLSGDVLIVDAAGNKADFSALKAGQSVFVYGTGDERSMKASKLLILE